jgi:hypothetical protein
MVHLWAEKQSLEWVPTFRPANLSALQNLAPFILVTASAADRPFRQADLVGVMSGAEALILYVAVEHLKRWRQGKERGMGSAISPYPGSFLELIVVLPARVPRERP